MTEELSSYTYSSTSFYVIVEPSVIDDRQLRMPNRFVQEHGDELLDTVRLIVPTDDFWCVGLKRAGQMIWLHDGWQEFMEHHSIDCWYFLFFKYLQNSCFNVHIFDLTATEIHYQLRSHDNAKLRYISQDLSHGKEKIVCNKDGESSVEIVDPLETEQGPEGSAKLPELSYRAKKRKLAPGRLKFLRCYETRSSANKLHDKGRVLNAKNLNIVDDSSLTKPLTGKLVEQNMDTSKSFTSQPLGCGRPRKRGRPWAAEVNRAINAAKMFMPKNPHFRQILAKYNVVRTNILNIPAEFAREHMPKTSDVIELQDSDGNKWKARCIRSKGQMTLSKGWLKFIRDNSLVVGDVCVFELIKDIQTDEILLKVHIFRSRVEENLSGDSSLTKPLGGKFVQQNMETSICSAQEGSENEVLQLNGRKHTESSDVFRPVSSNRTNCMSDTSKSFTRQQLEKCARCGSLHNRHERGRSRAAKLNRAINAAKMPMP